MTVKELISDEKFKIIVEGDLNKEILNGYAGDFLSNIISRAPDGCVWFTVMNNVNISGVAVLIDCACIILCEGVLPDESLLKRAIEQKINIISTKYDVFKACKIVAKIANI